MRMGKVREIVFVTVSPIKTVNDVDISTITNARKSLDYVDAGIDRFVKNIILKFLLMLLE